MATNKPKLLFVLPQELLNRIDDFQFGNRIKSRAETIRQLIEKGLKAATSKKPRKR